jgi:hypothetical protein
MARSSTKPEQDKTLVLGALLSLVLLAWGAGELIRSL